MCDIEEGRRLAHYQAQARIAALEQERDALAAALRKICNAPNGIAVINATAEARPLVKVTS